MLGLDNDKCIPVLNNNLMSDFLNKLTLIKVTKIRCLMLVCKGLLPQEIPSYPRYAQPNLKRQLPFIPTLEVLDLNHLTNDPINYAPWWLVIPHMLPSDIPKFNGNPGEDPSNHVMAFHLWCSSNSLNVDSIRLHLFHKMLIVIGQTLVMRIPSQGRGIR